MQLKHTPGPWRVSPPIGDGDYAVFSEKVNMGGNFYVAQLPNCPNPEAESNANLIAAAPELLAALNDVELRTTQARIASGIGAKKHRTQFLLSELERIATVARAAIAKAGGAQ